MTALNHASTEAVTPTLSLGTDYERLDSRFRPVFARIAEGVLGRERNRTLPHEQIEWLKAVGFDAVRVPLEHGGAGSETLYAGSAGNRHIRHL